MLVRSLLPLNPQQLPFVTVVACLSVTTLYAGGLAGTTCAIVGGLISWRMAFAPDNWEINGAQVVPLIGMAVISSSIVIASRPYRRSMELHHEREVLKLEKEAYRAELFAGELSHRLKNTLTIVQSIVLQSLERSSPEAGKLVERLGALAAATDVLGAHVSDPSAPLLRVIQAALTPFRDFDARIVLNTDEGAISSQQAVLLALAVHELASNAVKYGSLSSAEGMVNIVLLDQGESFKALWEESGGPDVDPPRTFGFGTKLLKRVLRHGQIEYAAGGLRCSFEVLKSPAASVWPK
ncbi:sensor histidine kinase [Sphingomonas trueperi]|uniref:sensor histidine kinase n=1 Tax=Sphingomonas trueperi TaxID=53317 RepID=UPI003393FCE2